MSTPSTRLSILWVVLTACFATPATATEWFVAPGGTGAGTAAAPFGRIQHAIDAAQAGDAVTVLPGTYTESLRTVRQGSSAGRIVIRSQSGRASVTVTFAGTVLRLDHPYITVEGVILDGQYAAADLVDVNTGAHFFILRDCEVRRTSRDALDLAAPQDVLIENSLIHRALNATNGRTDAHGIVAGAVQRLTIRNTEIHTFSGDAIQVDPGRALPGWSDVLIERGRFWLGPLAAAENGFPAGTVAGENAVDTKANANGSRSRLVIRDTVAWGFRGGLIGNMAAFNLKENVDAIVDRVTVSSSEIAFRLRGATSSTPVGAVVAVSNALVYDVATGVRYENAIDNLKIWNTTFGRNVTRAFQSASSASHPDVRNVLVLGTGLPSEAAGSSNRAVSASAFVDAAAHDYHLAAGSAAIDAGVAIGGVAWDRDGIERPQGSAPDIGAFERPTQASAGEVVLHAATATIVAGGWRIGQDATAAGGKRLSHPDAGLRVKNPQAYPAHYFELTFAAEANRPYRLWIRATAENNLNTNDAVMVQFSSTVAQGVPAYRIGTASVLHVSLEECAGCGLSGWGWQDHGQGLNVFGAPLVFATSGIQTVRVQTREDGISIDQIVLSPGQYFNVAPGPATNDTTLLTADRGY